MVIPHFSFLFGEVFIIQSRIKPHIHFIFIVLPASVKQIKVTIFRRGQAFLCNCCAAWRENVSLAKNSKQESKLLIQRTLQNLGSSAMWFSLLKNRDFMFIEARLPFGRQCLSGCLLPTLKRRTWMKFHFQERKRVRLRAVSNNVSIFGGESHHREQLLFPVESCSRISDSLHY